MSEVSVGDITGLILGLIVLVLFLPIISQLAALNGLNLGLLAISTQTVVNFVTVGFIVITVLTVVSYIVEEV